MTAQPVFVPKRRQIRTLALVTIACLSVCAMAGDDPPKADADRHLAPLAFLAGHCWEGEFDNGYRDVQCYDWLYQEKFLRSEHRVIGTSPQYEGITYYGWDPQRQRIRFHYFTSTGAVSEGYLEAIDGGFRVPEQHVDADGNVTEIETAFTQTDENHYSAASRRRADGEWRILHTAVYRRLDATESP